MKNTLSWLWVWWKQVFNAWALVLALVVFLPLGFAAGYNVRQPALTMDSTTNLLKAAQDLRRLLLKAEGEQAQVLNERFKAVDDAADAVSKAVASTRNARKAIPAAQIDQLDAASAELHRTVNETSFAYHRKLDENLSILNAVEKQLKDRSLASSSWQSVFYDQLKRFLKWIGAVSFITIVACALLILALCHPGIRRMVAKTGTLSAFGVSFSFSDLQSVRASVEARQSDLERDVKGVYMRVLRDSGVGNAFVGLMRDVRKAFADKQVTLDRLPYRATLFVPGFVGQELVQATRYAGRIRLGDETAIGRRFSVRYGIIGKAWRLKSCLYYPNVQNTNNNLLRDWGFTAEEARPFPLAASGGPAASLMAFPVSDIGDAAPLGVIYIEVEGGDLLHPATTASPSIIDPDSKGRTSADEFAYAVWAAVPEASKEKLRKQLIRLQAVMRWNDKIQEGVGR